MTKYTIKNIFDKAFPLKIWKIAVDADLSHIAIELRDMQTTQPYLYVLDFQGNTLLSHHPIADKTWTLESVRNNTIILKAVGEAIPVKEGILLIDFMGQEKLYLPDYILLDTYRQHLKIRHRSFQSGFEKHINLYSHTAFTIDEEGNSTYCQSVEIPVLYPYNPPPFLKEQDIQDNLWLSQAGNKMVWSYHTRQKEEYTLNLCVTTASKVLYEQRIMTHLPKMVPQPYFQVRNQIFLMSYNKQEIVSYLV